jgi:hypothetical protein
MQEMPRKRNTVAHLQSREIGASNDVGSAAIRAQQYVLRVLKRLMISLWRLITLESQGNVVAAYMRRLNQRAQARMEDRMWE